MLYLKVGENKYIKLEKAVNHKYVRREPDGKGGLKYFYADKDNKPSVRIESKFDPAKVFKLYSRIGFEERIGSFEENSQIVETKSIKIGNKISFKKDAEYCGILNSQGETVFTKKGTKEGIDFETDEANKIKRSKVLIHNHIEDRSISPDDIFLALFLGIEEIKAVYENKIFSFKISYKEKSETYFGLIHKNQTIINEITKITRSVQDRLQKNILMKEEKDRDSEYNKSNFQEQRQICILISESETLKKLLNMEYKEYDNIN